MSWESTLFQDLKNHILFTFSLLLELACFHQESLCSNWINNDDVPLTWKLGLQRMVFSILLKRSVRKYIFYHVCLCIILA